MRDERIAVTEFRKNLNEALERAELHNLILLRHSAPAGVVMAFSNYQRMLDRLEDLEDQLAVAEHRLNPSPTVDHADVAAAIANGTLDQLIARAEGTDVEAPGSAAAAD